MTRRVWALLVTGLLAGCSLEPIAERRATPTAEFVQAVAPTPTSAPTVTPTSAPTIAPTPTSAASPAAFTGSGLVSVGDHQLYMACSGAGSPTIVMDAGLGDTSATWSALLPDVQAISRVCVYDRAGLGRSEPGPRPRTSPQIVAELRELLQNSGVAGPYVLVGHSFGGLNMRLFASQFRADVAGLVLVDALAPDQWVRFEQVLEPREVQQIRGWLRFNPEGVDLERSLNDARSTIAPLGDLPLIVLTSGLQPGLPPQIPADRSAALWAAQRQLQAELAQASSAGTQVIAETSGHVIQNDQPALVIDAIRQVVDAARTR